MAQVKHGIVLLFLLKLASVQAQSIDDALSKYLKNDVPTLQINELKTSFEEYLLLDAREYDEYIVSKIEGAIFVGHSNFKIEEIQKMNLSRKQKIVVYCSIGVRSEEVARKIQQQTPHQVYNLYGGIFEWKNQLNPIYDQNNRITEKVHAYSKKWSKYLKNAEIIY
ncbi:MAG: rhodanese-like domain-containing protein [Flavobacteriaceae bacterium]|nr:rhodanese-like domain-containing protein [Flavobacteriaceae bacterium]